MASAVVIKRDCAVKTGRSVCEPDMSYLHRFNDVGGRPDERLGTKGAFLPGVQVMAGGPARDVPLDAEIHPGNVLHTFPGLKPDTSGEARTNVVGGRPGERLGSRGGFVRRIRAWSGGEPRDVPAGREVLDHGIVLHRVMRDRQLNDRQLNGQPAEELFCGEGDEVSKVIEDDFLDIEESGSLDVVVENQPLMAAPTSDGSAFRRCGSESKFPMGDDLVSGPFTAF